MGDTSTGRPILTVSRDLSFDVRSRQGTKDEQHTDTDTGKYDGYGIYLNEDWDSGIGGGLWTTGLALAKYFAASPHFLQQFRLLQLKRRWNAGDDNNRPVRVLELGSGNGFLSVCLVTAIAAANEDEEPDPNSNCWPGIEVVVTDTAEHLNLMKTTIESNLKRIFPKILQDQQNRRKNSARNETTEDGGGEGDDDDDDEYINDGEQDETSSCCSPRASFDLDIEKIASVKEYLWGESYDFGSDPSSSSFDLIVGSDVAYRDYLHDPLIAALKVFSRQPPHPTVALIGVTMNDTKPIFFEKLKKEGFCYEKLADHLFDKEFSTCSRQFGIFAISRI